MGLLEFMRSWSSHGNISKQLHTGFENSEESFGLEIVRMFSVYWGVAVGAMVKRAVSKNKKTARRIKITLRLSLLGRC